MLHGSTGWGNGHVISNRQERGGAWRGCVLLLLALGLAAGCSSPAPESQDERLGVASQAVNGGTLDTTGQYSAVVGVFRDNGSFATGVALSDRVVATAAHLVGSFLRGCDGFAYGQPTFLGAPPSTRLWVRTADSNGTVLYANLARDYAVDAMVGRRRITPLTVRTAARASRTVAPRAATIPRTGWPRSTWSSSTSIGR